MKWILAAAATIALAAPAQAEWLQARSRHFVIYSDTTPAAIADLATRLERVDASMRFLSGFADRPESAANPVTVYVVDDLPAIRRLARRQDVAGFYVPRAAGAVAFTPRRGGGSGIHALSPQIVLFHEYAHHFMLSNTSVAYPAWFAEGYAEFASTVGFNDGKVTIGGAAQHRAYEIFTTINTPMAALFSTQTKPTPAQQAQIYGRGWLLTHYAMLNRERRAQLEKYLVAINAGKPSIQAAEDNFGDLKQLDRELDRYARNKLPGFILSEDRFPVGKIDVRPLTPGERALIDMRMISTRGVDEKTAAPLYARAARAAQAYPNDVAAQGWLAEMAYDAGQDDAAEAAADRALAADPRSTQALLYKARVRLRRAGSANNADPKIWREARSWIVKANRINNDDAAALELFYDSFAMESAKPSASAVAGLHRALELAPQDRGLRFKSVSQHLTDGQVAEAKRALRPLAFDPHAGSNNPAARLMTLLDQGQAGPAALAAMAKAEENKAEEKPDGTD